MQKLILDSPQENHVQNNLEFGCLSLMHANLGGMFLCFAEMS